MKGKALVFSAPSGSGKTTIVRHLLNKFDNLGFSVSATTRKPRNNEVDGVDYHFLSKSDFLSRIDQGAFVEFEQVYEGLYYGTLKSEIDKCWANGIQVIFDVDVKGGLALKKYFGENCLAVFVKAPSIDVLRNRLKERNTDSKDIVEERITKAEYEMSFEGQFDMSLVNDDLKEALHEIEIKVAEFLNN